MAENNLTYRDNDTLKRGGVQISYTQQQIDEYIKCSQDEIYFIENYVKIINLDQGLIKFKMWDFQKKLINLLHNERFVISKIARQQGKCNHKDTIIKIRNKKTGETKLITMQTFYDNQKNKLSAQTEIINND